MRYLVCLLLAVLLACAVRSTVQACYQNTPVALATVTGNNTSACTTQSYCSAPFSAMTNSADAGAQTVTVNPVPGNVSTLDIHTLLPVGTRVIAHSTDWFVTTPGVDHDQTNYNSNDAATVAAQDNDMIQRHFDGRAIDYYGEFNTVTDGAVQKISADLAARCLSPQNCPLEYMIIEDQGAVTRAQGSRIGCTVTDSVCLQADILQDLCYANSIYFGSKAYVKMSPSTHAWATSTNPVVGFFPPSTTTAWNTAVANLKALTASNGWALANCPAGEQQANGGLIFFNSDSTNVADATYSGASSWIDPQSWSTSNQLLWDGTGNNTYHEALYSSCNANPSDLCIGSAKKGFNDFPTPPFASWGTNRIMAQRCAQVWINSLAKAALFTGSNLTLQIATWNDYEEGSEIETGIDNCYRLGTPTLSTNTLNWSAALSTNDSTYAPISSGQPTNGTADHWKIRYCNASNNCQVAADNIPLATLSQDLSTAVPAGTWSIYVQLVGKNSIWNQISSAVSYTH